MTVPLGLFARLQLALRVLGDAGFATRVARLADEREGAPALEARATPALPPANGTSPAPMSTSSSTTPAATASSTPPEPAATAASSAPARADSAPGALHLLAILQREGRFVDFISEEVAPFTDAEIGAAARVVHEGCRKALFTSFTFEPVRKESEGAPITVERGFDATSLRVTGNVTGEPPFSGKLAHAGWRVVEVRLPSRAASDDGRVVAPAEVELA